MLPWDVVVFAVELVDTSPIFILHSVSSQTQYSMSHWWVPLSLLSDLHPVKLSFMQFLLQIWSPSATTWIRQKIKKSSNVKADTKTFYPIGIPIYSALVLTCMSNITFISIMQIIWIITTSYRTSSMFCITIS